MSLIALVFSAATFVLNVELLSIPPERGAEAKRCSSLQRLPQQPYFPLRMK